MFKKLFTISLVLVFASTLIMAQTAERIVLKPGGGILQSLDGKVPVQDALQKTSIKFGDREYTVHKFAQPSSIEAAGTIDTLNYPDLAGGNFNTNFVFDGQDVEMMWFEAPADLTIKAAGFSCSDIEGNTNNATVSVRLMKLNWTAEELKNATAPMYQGYYPSVGDGMNESDPYGEDATGEWISKDENHPLPPWTNSADPDANTWEYDLWSDFGVGVPITAELQADYTTYQWIEMNVLEFEPTVLRGEIFAVVLLNDGQAWDNPDTPDRVGFFSDDQIGYPGWKYYEAGRLAAEDPGWWIRKYTWNFAVIADLTGDRPPVIADPTQVLSGLAQGPWTVEATITDDNPSGGNAGVAEALVQISTDDRATWTDISMTASGDLYSAEIPTQEKGTIVQYKISATDVEGGTTVRDMKQFAIWKETAPTLILENGSSQYLAYYFGYADFPHDTWTEDLGAGSTELFDLYDNIIELTANNSGPRYDHDSLIAVWLAADGSRNYALMGDEYLGVHSGWENGPHEAGDFKYDVLGITYEYNDVNLPDPTYAIPSVLETAPGSLLGDSLAVSLAAAAPDDTLWYDPDAIFGGVNFLDGVDVTEDSEVDLYGYGSNDTLYNVAHHRTLAAGNKIAFMGYDVLSLLSLPTDLWWSSGTVAPHYQLLDWWGVINSVREIDGTIPNEFNISQNYPNPFNPTTVIRYSIPEASKVSLKVFNTLGQEVVELVNTEQASGNYEVDFNASQLSSGVYFYTIKAGQFTSTMKMMLIK
ncbi:MAG: T9SS type A sorting domain-containing protein [Bacteroidota bacterium]